MYFLFKSELWYLQDFKSTEHFKQGLVNRLNYYDNRASNVKLKILPSVLRTQ